MPGFKRRRWRRMGKVRRSRGHRLNPQYLKEAATTGQYRPLRTSYHLCQSNYLHRQRPHHQKRCGYPIFLQCQQAAEEGRPRTPRHRAIWIGTIQRGRVRGRPDRHPPRAPSTVTPRPDPTCSATGVREARSNRSRRTTMTRRAVCPCQSLLRLHQHDSHPGLRVEWGEAGEGCRLDRYLER